MAAAAQGTAALDLARARERVAAVALRPTTTRRVGLELEQHLVDLAAPARPVAWDRLLAAVAALPPMPGGSAVSLEPGGQVELSTPPYDDVAAAVSALRRDDDALRAGLRGQGLGLASLGADPARPPRRCNPAPRYAAMERHWAARGCGPEGARMMCGTASLQLNLDAGPAAGWADRVALAHLVGPVLVAVSACSPVEDGRATGWRSTRQRTWGRLDQARCGPILAGRDPVREWAEYALLAPVMLVRGDGGAAPVTSGATFADWLDGDPRCGRPVRADDLDYHLTTLFPPVRLKGFLELRYLDAAPVRWWPALAALGALLLDDPCAAGEAAAACAPVAGAWTTAARRGLADPGLHRAARTCLAAAVRAAPPALREDLEDLAELVEAGRCPGDAVQERVRRDGPLAVLEEEARG
ncbi:ergothioneine biosynthesis glutamate--cysteine ligase EgtA [Vallicoccus soli]|uniref:Glutamate--cysteine ligase EgtA n=1 Tax=Vallicoccus soli TaxID=2339232 RepID=A0A3A3Z383_9ACTN|nr:ergothioneine biosynthesis glutamate--cysteine ligase EgtA [Vallicoccus soli]RJK97164.1 ergothioneine biosynthesis glutamate--cysteine ligase EgtA [Vallicoccus soli]